MGQTEPCAPLLLSILSQARIHHPCCLWLNPTAQRDQGPQSPEAEVVRVRKPTSSRICPEIWIQDSTQNVWAITTLILCVCVEVGVLAVKLQEKERAGSQ